jgi:viroplasmin and RNaseH domain-containing protein
MPNQYYYAVNKGKKPGIYLSWTECKEQVNGYNFPIYKKFETIEEAEDFVKNGKMSKIAKMRTMRNIRNMTRKRHDEHNEK